ncbi:MAG: protein serine/threonine phosphatase 2C family protein [Dehalococcoidia bacterium]|nr:protein serine/threonine phosphatase 2C family protein [Dehalococcoidia bacterium]
MKSAVILEKGMRREMEDTCFLDLDFGSRGWVFGGVYDGHGGLHVAKYAAENLHHVFLEKLSAGSPIPQAFAASYEEISNRVKAQDYGATAVNFLIEEGVIHTANAGDARAIVIGADVHQLTVDHRLDNIVERERIESMGGVIQDPYTFRNEMGLMPTRTLGDEYFRPVGIMTVPSTGVYAIARDDRMLLAATDGLFDFMTNEEVASFAGVYPHPAELLEALKTEVLINRRGSDNLTIIAISLRE